MSVKGDTILGIENDGKLSTWADGKQSETGRIPDINESTITRFSPDQRYLVTAPHGSNETNCKKDSAVILWEIGDIKKNSVPVKIILDSNNIAVKQITFAPNSRQFFILDSHNLIIYDTGKKEKVKIPDVEFAQFSQAGNHIIIISKGGSVNVIDSSGNNTAFIQTRLDTNYLKDLKSFSISPDWKKILLKKEGNLYMVEKAGGVPILSTSIDDQGLPLKIKYLKYFSQDNNLIKTSSFISNNSILSVNKTGNIFLWKSNPYFQNIDDALSNIQLPDLTILEKLEQGSISFKEVELSNDEHVLRETAEYFERKAKEFKYSDGKNFDTSSNRALILYKKLLSFTNGNKQLYYLDKLTALNRSFKNVRSKDTSEQMMMVKRINENIELLRNQNKNDPKNTALARRLSVSYNDLSFHLLFIKNYDKSIEACNEGLAADPTNVIIYTNLALAYLLSKNFAEAEKIYNGFKDKWIQSIALSFRDGFLQDFGDLKRAGVITDKEKVIYDKVEEIQKMLESVKPVKNDTQLSVNLNTQRK